MKPLLKGSTLIEALIALLIMGGMLVLFQIATQQVPLSRQTSNEDTALRVARTKIESVRALGYANIPASGTFSDPTLTTLPSATATLTVSEYNVKTKEVEVTIVWREPNASSDSTVSLTTLITEAGGL